MAAAGGARSIVRDVSPRVHLAVSRVAALVVAALGMLAEGNTLKAADRSVLPAQHIGELDVLVLPG